SGATRFSVSTSASLSRAFHTYTPRPTMRGPCARMRSATSTGRSWIVASTRTASPCSSPRFASRQRRPNDAWIHFAFSVERQIAAMAAANLSALSAKRRSATLSRPVPAPNALPDFTRLQVAVVGDVIADHYLVTEPRSLSREAPVMVLRYTSEHYQA